MFSIDNGLNKFSCVVTLLLEKTADDIHDLWAKRWASHEDSLNDCASDLLKLTVDVLNEFEGWLTEFVELWLEEIDKHVN